MPRLKSGLDSLARRQQELAMAMTTVWVEPEEEDSLLFSLSLTALTNVLSSLPFR